jgi:hypothetical protein
MSEKKYKLVRVLCSGDGEVHYATSRGEFDPASTYCGHIDNVSSTYTKTTKKVTCDSCAQTAKVFVNGVIL